MTQTVQEGTSGTKENCYGTALLTTVPLPFEYDSFLQHNVKETRGVALTGGILTFDRSWTLRTWLSKLKPGTSSGLGATFLATGMVIGRPGPEAKGTDRHHRETTRPATRT